MKTEHHITSWNWMDHSLLQLTSDEVHVWGVDLNRCADPVPSFNELLSSDELERAERFKFDIHKHQFVTFRGMLRKLVGRYLDIEPSTVQFHYNDQGKPSVAPSMNALNLQFNLSHSNDVAAFAFVRDQEIGVDIEQINNTLDWKSMAPQVFHHNELSHLQQIPTSEQIECFYRYWTSKEAFLKATGIGIDDTIHKLDFSPLINGHAEVFTEPEEGNEWVRIAFAPLEHTIGSLMIQRKVLRITVYNQGC